MKRTLAVGLFVLALSGGYVAAEGVGNMEARGASADKSEVTTADHARFCTKDMNGKPGNGAIKAPMNDKEHNPKDSNKPHKHT